MVLSNTTLYRIRCAPETAFIGYEGERKHRQVRFPEFEAAFLWFFRLNDGEAVLTDDLLLEKARSIQDQHQIHEEELSLSNGWLNKFKTWHEI